MIPSLELYNKYTHKQHYEKYDENIFCGILFIVHILSESDQTTGHDENGGNVILECGFI